LKAQIYGSVTHYFPVIITLFAVFMNEHYAACMCVEQKQYFKVNITVPSLMCTDIFVLLYYTPQYQTHAVSD